MNLVEAQISNGRVRFGGFDLPAPAGRGLESYEGGTLILGIRPSDFEDASLAHNPDLPVIEVMVDVIEELGSEVHLLFTVAAPPLPPTCDAPPPTPRRATTCCSCTTTTTRTARPSRPASAPRRPAAPGQTVKLTVDPQAFHFFDPSDGASLARRVEAGVA